MVNDLKTYINPKNPLFRFFLFLSLFGIISFIDLIIPTPSPTERGNYILIFGMTMLFALVLLGMTRYGFGMRTQNPLNFFISAWIVFLLIHPTTSLWYYPVALAMIILGKKVLRWNNLTILNPAGLALALTTFLSTGLSFFIPEADTFLVSWWGADLFQNTLSSTPLLNLAIPITLLAGLFYFAKTFKKIPYVLSFYATFLSITFINSSITMPFDRSLNLVSLMIFNATAFFALVMLTEPKTSPIFQGQQLVIGCIAGISLFVANTYFGFLPIDPLILTLLVANCAVFVSKVIPKKRPVIGGDGRNK